MPARVELAAERVEHGARPSGARDRIGAPALAELDARDRDLDRGDDVRALLRRARECVGGVERDACVGPPGPTRLSDNGGPQSCECKVNDQLVKTCTTTSDSACSLPGNGNCCGF